MNAMQNKYTTWYFNIIDKAKKRYVTSYVEKHHIIPKSLGGSDSKDNLVRLTPKEHFICHMLLIRMLTGQQRGKMLQALWYMSNKKSTTKHVPRSRLYEKLRNEYISYRKTQSSHMKGKKHTEETKKIISEKTRNTHKGQNAWNTGLTKNSDERIAQMYVNRKTHDTWKENFRKTPEREGKRLESIVKPVVINGVEYFSAKEAYKVLGNIKYITLIKRIKSNNFPDYRWK
jgi:NUMOD3 motif